MLDKKYNFIFCISKTDKEIMCELKFVCSFLFGGENEKNWIYQVIIFDIFWQRRDTAVKRNDFC